MEFVLLEFRNGNTVDLIQYENHSITEHLHYGLSDPLCGALFFIVSTTVLVVVIDSRIQFQN